MPAVVLGQRHREDVLVRIGLLHRAKRIRRSDRDTERHIGGERLHRSYMRVAVVISRARGVGGDEDGAETEYKSPHERNGGDVFMPIRPQHAPRIFPDRTECEPLHHRRVEDDT